MMKEDPTTFDASQQEVSVLSKALSKSVEMSLRNRYIWTALLAGFIVGAAVAVAVFMLAGSQQQKTAHDEILLKRSRETLQTVIQLQSQVDRLIGDRRTIPMSTESERTAPETQTASEALENNGPRDLKDKDKAVVETGNDGIDLGRFTVYIHFSGKIQKQTMNRLAAFLRTKGYTVPETERVTNRRRDVRYFHKEDREGAEYLLRDTQDFMKTTPGIHDIHLDSIDLSRVYPEASKGALELWIYF